MPRKILAHFSFFFLWIGMMVSAVFLDFLAAVSYLRFRRFRRLRVGRSYDYQAYSEVIVTKRNLAPVRKSGHKRTLPQPNDDIVLIEPSPRTVPYACGHQGPEYFSLNVYGILVEPSTRNRCPECLMERIRSEVTRCSSCGLPVFPGWDVALYGDSSKLPYHKQSFRVSESYLGCMRKGCCSCEGYRVGHWTGKRIMYAP